MSSEESTNEPRFWESGDFCVSKAVLEEGLIDAEAGLPRFGSQVSVVLGPSWSVSGDLSLTDVTSNPVLSKLLHQRQPDQPTTITFRSGNLT